MEQNSSHSRSAKLRKDSSISQLPAFGPFSKDESISSVHTQDDDISQGSPLSGTLFLVAINDIFRAIPYLVKPLLIVDVLSIHMQSGCARHAHRILRSVITLIEEWLSSPGYRISLSKTEMIIFENR